MRSDHRAGALAVEIQVADVELHEGSVELSGGVGVKGSGQTVLGVIGNRERIIEVPRFDYGKYRAKDLFLGNAGRWCNIGKYGGLNVLAVFFGGDSVAAQKQLTFRFP